MIPAALFAMLAISRIGAIHTVVFGGFAPASLAQRIEASKPRVVMTASCGIEGAKGPIGYQPFVEGALAKSGFKPEKTIVWQREQLRWDPINRGKGERHWQKLVEGAKRRGIRADAVPVRSEDGLYIIYTSGKYSCIENQAFFLELFVPKKIRTTLVSNISPIRVSYTLFPLFSNLQPQFSLL